MAGRYQLARRAAGPTATQGSTVISISAPTLIDSAPDRQAIFGPVFVYRWRQAGRARSPANAHHRATRERRDLGEALFLP
jgi:hypothetical protein